MAKQVNNGCRCRPCLRFTIYTMQNFKCMYCRKDLSNIDRNKIHLDHLVCQSHGGSNDPDNLVVSCQQCNTSRGNMRWEVFSAGKGCARRIKNWIVKMNTEEGKEEFKITRKVVQNILPVINGKKTCRQISKKLQ